MQRINLLSSFPKSKRNLEERNISKRNINLALKYSKEYFDGSRSQGYGGYYYDGRWVKIARKIIKLFKLKNNSKFIDVGCAKGFLMYDLKTILPNIKIYGIDISKYAKQNSLLSVINIPPPKFFFVPDITTSPFFPPIIQGDFDIIKALLVSNIFWFGFTITL